MHPLPHVQHRRSLDGSHQSQKTKVESTRFVYKDCNFYKKFYDSPSHEIGDFLILDHFILF